MNRFETLPESWVAERDEVFFAVTHRLFASSFVAGAGVLLASYDDDVNETTPASAPVVAPSPRRRHCTSTWV